MKKRVFKGRLCTLSWHSRCFIQTGAIVAGFCFLLALTGCQERRSSQYRQQGDSYLHLGKIDEAAAAYERAKEADPKNVLAVLGLGRCAVQQNDAEGALAYFAEARQLDPSLAVAYVEAVRVFAGPRQDRGSPRRGGRTRKPPMPNAEACFGAFVLRNAERADDALRLLADLL